MRFTAYMVEWCDSLIVVFALLVIYKDLFVNLQNDMCSKFGVRKRAILPASPIRILSD